MNIQPSQQRLPPGPSAERPASKKASYSGREITALPPEIMEKIFVNLSLRDLVTCRRVQRHWHDLVETVMPRVFCRQYHPMAPVLVQRDYPSVRTWLRGFGQQGRELAAWLAGPAQSGQRNLPELISFSVAKVVAETKAFHCKKTTFEYSDRICSARISPDEQHLVTASDHRANIYSLIGRQWREVAVLPHASRVIWARFSPNSQHIITGSSDNSSQVWGFIDRRWHQQTTVTHAFAWARPCFSADTHYLVTVSVETEATISTLVNGQWQANGNALGRHKLVGARFHPTDHHLLATWFRQDLLLWRPVAGEWREVVRFVHDSEVYETRFSPAGDHLVALASGITGGNNEVSVVYIWHHVDGMWHKEAALLFPDLRIMKVHFSRYGDHLLLRSNRNAMELWQCQNSIWERVNLPFIGSFSDGQFSADGRRLVTEHTTDPVEVARVWTLTDQQWREQAILPDFSWWAGVSFNAHGNHVITNSAKKIAEIWGIVDNSWQVKATLVHSARLHSTKFSPQGLHVLTTTWDHDIDLWTLTIWTF